MKFILIKLILSAQLAFANNGILLVAGKNTPLSDYQIICAKNNYLCFPKAYKTVIKPRTIYFNNLMENFDLDNKDYVANFSKNVQLSLKNDDLNLDQIKYLILASEKLVQKDLLKILRPMYSLLSAMPEENSEQIIFTAGKSIANTLKNRSALEPYLKEIKFVQLDYASFTENTESAEKKYFLNGDCEHPRYAEFVSQLELQVIPHFSEGCNLSQRYNWGTDLMKDHFSEHKNKYLLGIAAVATVFLMKNYDVVIEN